MLAFDIFQDEQVLESVYFSSQLRAGWFELKKTLEKRSFDREVTVSKWMLCARSRVKLVFYLWLTLSQVLLPPVAMNTVERILVEQRTFKIIRATQRYLRARGDLISVDPILEPELSKAEKVSLLASVATNVYPNFPTFPIFIASRTLGSLSLE